MTQYVPSFFPRNYDSKSVQFHALQGVEYFEYLSRSDQGEQFCISSDFCDLRLWPFSQIGTKPDCLDDSATQNRAEVAHFLF